MFKITPINDITLQEKYATECGAKFKDGSFAYAMIDIETDELMGFSQFEIDGDYGYIFDLLPRINYQDFEAMFILGRATMNFINLCGADFCICEDISSERLIKAIGFKLIDGKYTADMRGMFDGHCDGHSVKID